jgi:hypothetical protein
MNEVKAGDDGRARGAHVAEDEFFPNFGEGTCRKRWRAKPSVWEDITDMELKELLLQNVIELIWFILSLSGVCCEHDHKPSHYIIVGNFLTK